MSVIINKPAPGGSSGSPPTVTFDNNLMNYGDKVVDYDIEIRTDLLREITITSQSSSFSRSSGLGIDMYENESISELTKLTLRMEILSAVDRYNAKSTPEKQVILSQEMIDFDQEDGVLVVNIFYLQSKDLGTAQGPSAIQSITIPAGI
jgi:hypothetical protein